MNDVSNQIHPTDFFFPFDFYSIKLLQKYLRFYLYWRLLSLESCMFMCVLCSVYCSKMFSCRVLVTFVPLWFWRTLFSRLKPGFYSIASKKNKKTCSPFHLLAGAICTDQIVLEKIKLFSSTHIIMNLTLKMTVLVARNSLRIEQKILRKPLAITVYCT